MMEVTLPISSSLCTHLGHMPHSVSTTPSAAFMDHILTMLSADVIISFSFTGRLAPVPRWQPRISILAGGRAEGAVGS